MGEGIPHTACESHPRIFASVDPSAHQAAAAMCRQCPVLALCRRDLKDPAHSHYQGTWAGLLLTGELSNSVRKAAS